MEQKREWEEPELIVIIRCQPEESVLSVCKASRYVCGNEDGPTNEIAAS